MQNQYEELLNQLKFNNNRIKCDIDVGSNIIDQYIDVDNLYKLFYHLFKSNNLLEENNNISDVDAVNKFSFTEEYPDEVMNDRCTVTFEISRRECADFSAKTAFMSESHIQYRPMFLYEKEDFENGGVSAYYMQPYDNEITMYCWSSKVKYARNIAGLIENILLSSYYFIKQRVGILLYKGRYAPIIKTQYGNKGLVGIPIKILVRTYEINCVKKHILDKLPQLILEDIK
jgi:hypothetical protein